MIDRSNLKIGRSRAGSSFFCKIMSVATLLMAASLANAQTASGVTGTNTGNASASIVDPVSINVTNSQLRFGSLLPSNTPGTATINPRLSPNVEVAGGVIAISDGTQPGAALFTVTGKEGVEVTISVPSSVTLVSNSNSSDTMVTSLFANISTPPGALPNIFTLQASPTIVSIGGALQVGADQPIGEYSEEFNVTISYQ